MGNQLSTPKRAVLTLAVGTAATLGAVWYLVQQQSTEPDTPGDDNPLDPLEALALASNASDPLPCLPNDQSSESQPTMVEHFENGRLQARLSVPGEALLHSPELVLQNCHSDIDQEIRSDTTASAPGLSPTLSLSRAQTASDMEIQLEHREAKELQELQGTTSSGEQESSGVALKSTKRHFWCRVRWKVHGHGDQYLLFSD